MEPEKIQPDYSFLQNTQPTNPIEPQKKKFNPWLVTGLAFVVLLLGVAAFVVLLDSPKGSTKVVDGELSAQEAAPAIATANNFIRLMGENNVNQAASLVSPVGESGGVFNDQVAQGYFGEGLDWAGCRQNQADAYAAYTTTVVAVGYDVVTLEYTCEYADGRGVVVALDMNRAHSTEDRWLFSTARVRDEGLPANVI